MPGESPVALIVVDMQNAFVEIAGEAGPSVVEAVNEHVAEANDHGWPVFFTQDIKPFGDATAEQIALHPKLDTRGTIVPKGPGVQGGFSGFVLLPAGPHDPAPADVSPDRGGPGDGGFSTLAGLLSDSGAASVIVTGIAADVCVAATARDAVRLGYPATIPLRATAFVHARPDGDEAAVDDLRQAGVTVIP